jgi:hypothetical protein
MAITYHAGRRIQGLSQDALTFEDDFTSDKGWVESGSQFTVDTSTDNRLEYAMKRTGNTNDYVYKDLTSVSDTAWVLRYHMVHTSETGNNAKNTVPNIGLSSITGSTTTSQDMIGLNLQFGQDDIYQTRYTNNAASSGATGSTNFSTGITGSDDYYVEIIRTSANEFTIEFFSDEYSTSVEKVTQAITSGQEPTGLRYLGIQLGHGSADDDILNGYLDDIEFYNGVTTAGEYDTKPTNVQAGSRFEETDTRKMYHNVVLTNGTTSENAGWYEEGTTTPQYPPTRGVWASGYTNAGGGRLDTIDYATIATAGNATDFGNMIVGRETPAGVSSYTRGIIGGGIDLNSGVTGAITAEYITILTTGNATTFGDLTVCRSGISAVTNKSRGVWYGGQLNNNTVNTIDYVTIDTTGNATTFGVMNDATTGAYTNKLTTGVNDATRGCFGGGYIGGASGRVDYITIATTGNASVFGTLYNSRTNYNMGSVSSDTRGVFAGGNGNVNTIDYITIATLGSSATFGTMNVGISGCQGNSDGTRGVFAGGWITNAMEYITIATTGNGTDFGDLTVARDAPAGGLVG